MINYVDVIKKHAADVPSIAEKAGVSVNTIRAWLYGGRSPSVHNLKAVMNAIGYDVVIIDLEG